MVCKCKLKMNCKNIHLKGRISLTKASPHLALQYLASESYWHPTWVFSLAFFSSLHCHVPFVFISPWNSPLSGSSCQSHWPVLCPLTQPQGSIQPRWQLARSWNTCLGFCDIMFVWFSSYLTSHSSFPFAPSLLGAGPGLCVWAPLFFSWVSSSSPPMSMTCK